MNFMCLLQRHAGRYVERHASSHSSVYQGVVCILALQESVQKTSLETTMTTLTEKKRDKLYTFEWAPCYGRLEDCTCRMRVQRR